MAQKTLLMILDGWGNSPDPTISAVDQARTPYIDSLYENYANSTLRTDGEHVGLPEGQMGNSEVGHMNLGAGRIVYQDLAKINLAVQKNELRNEKVLTDSFEYAKKEGKKVHLLGLLSDGGVHSHINHIKALVELAKKQGVKETYVHAFLDGRDVPPRSALIYLEEIEEFMAELNYGSVASVHGRYYAMDRDKNWDRIQLAYDVLVEAKGPKFATTSEGVNANYENGIDDEFVIPFNVDSKGIVGNKDSVIFANFRPDRAMQLAGVLTNANYNPKPEDCNIINVTVKRLQ